MKDTSLRVATFLCQRCHRDAKAVCTIWRGSVRQLWCATCLGEARRGDIRVARETCQQCNSRAEATSDVFWNKRYRIWCLRCVEEMEYLLSREGETQDGRVDDENTPTVGGSRRPAALSLLNDRYRLLALTGQGGFGAVYRAEDTAFANRLVAVKEIAPGRGSQPSSARKMFEREARMLAGLMHAQLPRIYDYFVWDERYYLVMDYLEGLTLERYAQQAPGGRLPLVQVLSYGIQLCNVLEYLHGREPHPIVFRDLKPSNIILGKDGILYLIDFGIARFFKVGQTHDTMGFGSPGYAAPEQYGAGQTTVRADIYSLGATLHRLLSGDNPARQPFSFSPLPCSEGPAIRETEQLVRRMVSMDVSKRPERVASVRADLQRILASLIGDGSASARKGGTPGLSPTETTLAVPPGKQFYSGTTLYGPSARITGLAWSPDGRRVASTHYDGAIQVWDTASGGSVLMLRIGLREARAVSWSPDGASIAIQGDDASVRIWDTHADKARRSYQEHSLAISSIAWSPDGSRIASADAGGCIRIWEPRTGKTLQVAHPQNSVVGVLAWSPDGSRIVFDGQRCQDIWRREIFPIRVWDVGQNTLREIASYRGHHTPVGDLRWSNRGDMIASTGGTERSIRIWHPSTGKTLALCRWHADHVHRFSWWTGQDVLVSVDLGGQVCKWDATTGRRLSLTCAPIERVWCTAWSPDGRKLAFAAPDMTVHIWCLE